MASIQTAIMALVGLSLGTVYAFAAPPCPELDGANPQVHIDYLLRDRSTLNPACIGYAIFQVSTAAGKATEDRRRVIVKVLVRYLDYRPFPLLAK